LRRLKDGYSDTMAGKVQAMLSNTSPGIPHDQKALKLAWFVGTLQRHFFLDSINDFCRLNFAERQQLVQFAPHREVSSGSIQAIIYTPSTPRRCRLSLQISRATNPPTAAEAEDLEGWTAALFSLISSTSSIMPSSWLRAAGLNDSTSVWPLLNFFLSIVVEDCPTNTACFISDTGECHVAQGDITPAAVLQLYYWALEAISRDSDTHKAELMLDERYHSSLFSLCYFCLQKAKHPLGARFLISDSGECLITFHRLVEAFVHALKPSSEAVAKDRALALPSYVVRALRQLQDMLLDMVWEKSFVDVIKRVSTCTWCQLASYEPSDEHTVQGNSREQYIVGYVMHHLTNVIERRVKTLCGLLGVPQATATTIEIFTKMLRHRRAVFFDRHPDQLMMCSLYTALFAEKKRTAFSFQQITNAYIEMNTHILGTEISHAIVHRIKNCSEPNNECGDIISLFNEVFVPNLAHLWPSFKYGQEEQLSKPSRNFTTHNCSTPEKETAAEMPHKTSLTSHDISTLEKETVVEMQSSEEKGKHTEDDAGMIRIREQ